MEHAVFLEISAYTSVVAPKGTNKKIMNSHRTLCALLALMLALNFVAGNMNVFTFGRNDFSKM
jgi:hypothetical protein